MNNNDSIRNQLLHYTPVLISIITLLVFIYQTNLIRQQQFMSVYPHMMLVNAGSGSTDYRFMLLNNGVGPALIREVAVTDSAGNSYESITAYLETQLTPEDSIWIYNSDLYPGRLIPANEQITLYGLHDSDWAQSVGLPSNTIEGANKFRDILNSEDLIIEITYESIYGESWTIDNYSPLPRKN